MSSGMGSPFDHREIMQAAMHFGETRTVAQVIADQEKRSKARTGKADKKGAAAAQPAPPSGDPDARELAKLNALLAGGRRPPPSTS